MSGTFAMQAPRYRKAGFQPRPIETGSKDCKIEGWQRFDKEIGEEEFKRWIEQFGQHGIGLLMGSQMPDGTTLGVVHTDDDSCANDLKMLLRGSLCGRVGSRGATFFGRVNPGEKGWAFQARGGHTIEGLFSNHICIIPPTIHPDTGQPYRWIGTPLLDIDPLALPLIGG